MFWLLVVISLLGFSSWGLAQTPTCHLVWDPVTQAMDGTPIPAADLKYRVYVRNLNEELVLGSGAVVSTDATIPCATVGFVSGKKAAVTAVHIPTGQESGFSNVVSWLVIPAPMSLHLEFR